MPAGIYNITIEQGSDYILILTLMQDEVTPMDLTGFSGRGQVRKTHKDNVVAASFTATIIGDPVDGVIRYSIPSADTALIETGETTNCKDSQYVYDIELVSGSGIVTRLLQGRASVSPEVTR